MNVIFKIAHILDALIRKKLSKQEWMHEKPSKDIKVDDGTQLNDIPFEGISTHIAITEAKVHTIFSVLKTINEALPYCKIEDKKLPAINEDAEFIITYNNGYDSDDITTDKGTIINNKLIMNHVINDDTITIKPNDNNKIYYTTKTDELSQDVDIKEVSMSDIFFVVKINSKATNFVTNIADGKKVTVTPKGNLSLALTFAPGYDADDIECDKCFIEDNKLYTDIVTGDCEISIKENSAYSHPLNISNEHILTELEMISAETADIFFYIIITNLCKNIVTFDKYQLYVNKGEDLKIKATFASGYDPTNVSVSYGQFVRENDVYYFIIKNIVNDYDFNIEEAAESSTLLNEENGLANNIDIVSTALDNVFYTLYMENKCKTILDYDESKLINGYMYINCNNSFSTNMYITPGFGDEDISVSDGYLQIGQFCIDNISKDTECIFSYNEIKAPFTNADGSDALGMFSNPEFKSTSQYKVLVGNGSPLNSYVYINDQPSSMNLRNIWSIDTSIIDINNYDADNIPGQIIANLATNTLNSTEVVTERYINGIKMYRHFVSLITPIILEADKEYLIPVRDGKGSYSENTNIAVIEDSNGSNIVNIDNEPIKDETGSYIFNWSRPNFNIYKTSMAVYFAANGQRI